jgi:hypothetical protein
MGLEGACRTSKCWATSAKNLCMLGLTRTKTLYVVFSRVTEKTCSLGGGGGDEQDVKNQDPPATARKRRESSKHNAPGGGEPGGGGSIVECTSVSSRSSTSVGFCA